MLVPLICPRGARGPLLASRLLVGISAYLYASRKFALIGNFLDTVDRGRKRA